MTKQPRKYPKHSKTDFTEKNNAEDTLTAKHVSDSFKNEFSDDSLYNSGDTVYSDDGIINKDSFNNDDYSNKDDLTKVKKKRKNPKKHKKLKIFLIILLSFLLLVALLATGVFLAYSCGKNSMKADPIEHEEGKVVYYNGNKYTYNENIISTLFIGYDQKSNDYNAGRSGQADFILLITFDTNSGVLNAVSIPRDTMVEVGQYVGEAYAGLDKKMQIALAYAYGDGGESSCENTKDAVSRLFYNMPIKNYLSLNMEGIGPINDSIGGVTLVPLETIPNSGINKGSQMTLMGKNAQKYVQYRDTNNSNSSEMRRQRDIQYFTEFFTQAISTSTNKVGTILNLFSVASKYVTTNIGIPELTYLAQIFSTKDVKNINVTSIDGTYSMGQKYVEFNADSAKLYETVLNIFYIREQ